MRLEVRLLGPLEVAVGGEPVRITGRPSILLLTLAMSASRIVSLDRLVTATWGHNLPANPRGSVQTNITRLRRLLGAGVIETDTAGYLLRAEPEQIDALRFLELLDLAASALDTRSERGRLTEALALWRGTPFEGVASVWLAESEAPRLVERYLAAVERRIDLDLAEGRHDGLAADLRDLIARYPLRESLWARLLSALDSAGRRAEALEHYEIIRRQIADELGADPGPQLREIHAELLSGGGVPTPKPAARGQPAPQRVVPRQLPLDIAGFVGREKVLAAMDSLIGDAASPLVVTAVGGAAGIGKTALAVHWAHRVADRFPDGQLYANLRGFDPSGQPRAPQEVLRGFLDALQVRPQEIPSGLEAQAGLYRSLLAGRRMLVVLDNARDAEQVRPLLPGARGSQVVVTSRDRLTGLIATEGARPVVLDALSTEEAWLLLDRRLGPQRVRSDPRATEEIIHRCAALPLALAVVAARAVVRPESPLRTLAAELDVAGAGLDAFAGSDPMIDVRAVFSWSYRTLSEPAARLFRLLSVHPGPDITAAAAASLAGLPLSRTRTLLAELTGAHLISEPVNGRYSCHDLLRAYAVEQSRSHDDQAIRRVAARRMLDHYVHSAHTAAMLLYPQREPVTPVECDTGVEPERFADHHDAMDWCRAEQAVLLGALSAAVSHGFDAHAWQLAWALVDVFDRQGRWHEIVATQQAAIEATRRLGERAAQAQAHRNIARAHGHLRNHDQGEVHLAQALRLYRELGDRVGEADTHRNRGWALELQGRYREAIEQSESALRLYRSAGDRVGQARALNGIGWTFALLGQHERALEHCREALVLHEEVGNRMGQAATCDSIGFACYHLGRYPEAAQWYQRSLDLFRDLGERFGETEALVHLGDVHAAAGDAKAAREFWRQALDILTELGHAHAEQVKAKIAGLKEV